MLSRLFAETPTILPFPEFEFPWENNPVKALACEMTETLFDRNMVFEHGTASPLLLGYLEPTNQPQERQ